MYIFVVDRGTLGFAVRVDRGVVLRVDFERLRASAAGVEKDREEENENETVHVATPLGG
jgi:hypothetical protein